MTYAPKDGGPAFPRAVIYDGESGSFVDWSRDGMTLRDWFAGQAPQMPSDVDLRKFERLVGRPYEAEFGSVEHWQFCADAEAAWRYLHADAMLAAREGKQ